MEIDKCVLCGCPDRDKRTDHLREVYKSSQDKLSRYQYHPRLTQEEMGRLQRGSNPVCSNMFKCRQRRRLLALGVNYKIEKEDDEAI